MGGGNQGNEKRSEHAGRPKGGKSPSPARSRLEEPSKDLVDCRHMHALTKPERVRILAILTERVASPKEISEELDTNLSGVSYHVTVLRKCGLIVEDHEVPRRGAVEHFYRATMSTVIPPDAWDNLPSAMRKGISTAIVREFLEDASDSMEAGIFENPPGEVSWTPLILDLRGVERIGLLTRNFLESVMEVQVEATQRLSAREDGAAAEDVTSMTVFLASFQSTRSPGEEKRASAAKRR